MFVGYPLNNVLVLRESVRDLVVPEVLMSEDDERCERGMDGTWRATCINHDLLFVRCAPWMATA